MPSKPRINIRDVDYRCYPIRKKQSATPPLQVIGIDSEALTTGRCFMVATSEGDVWPFKDWPRCVFGRKYEGATFVAYNLSYDEGAFLQKLTLKQLQTLREKGKVVSHGYTYKSIPKKMLSIRKGKNAITIYDMYNFYEGSLDYNAKKYLGEAKIEIASKVFTPARVRLEWSDIATYCIKDASLVKRLADLILARFRSYGMEPRKLFSTAYISYQYFSTHTNYPVVKRFWRDSRELLQFAMDAYNGGKFEVTRKGPGEFWEYDIVSAYPYEIAQLFDISWARVVRTNTIPDDALYGFVYTRGVIPSQLSSPCSRTYGSVCVYPVGPIHRCITLGEYYFLTSHGSDMQIEDAFFLCAKNRERPFAKEIGRLTELKKRFKKEGKALDYHTVKILLNSLYGKMVQLIPVKGRWKASTCWNPIYAAVITANVRIRVSELQTVMPSIVAVHTDSVLSTNPLPLILSTELGGWSLETSGKGILLGSGIYQVGSKVRFRGFETRIDLASLIDVQSETVPISSHRAFSWREVAFHGWPVDRVNLFQDIPRTLHCRFDHKRVWLNDWQQFDEALTRNVDSIPHSELTLGAPP